MEIIFLILLFVLGSCFGSFLCCQARRLRLKEQGNKRSHQPTTLGPRSVCLHCRHQLKWYDNIPIFSWLFLKGRCRNCHKKIGFAEFLSELGTATIFLILGTTINLTIATLLEWAIFIAVLVFALPLIFLAIYDGLYGELPTMVLIIALICATVILGLKVWAVLSVSPFTPELIWQPALAVFLLGGLYLVLYLVSKGKWVGDGDWLLGSAIALALANAWLALITLFVANLLASFYAIFAPGPTRQRKIHLGPFLVIAFIMVYAFSDVLCAII